jgi:hypothetical protein
MEIIFNIQAAITGAKTLKKPLYIMVQDLSKAYDRVDIPLLEKALQRICISQNFIKFILTYLLIEKIKSFLMIGLEIHMM